ncbi:hypothetical protein G7085_10570 [Tessaracoccus sp. HDW20]|uniref:hypothetical protein n=1 Tax=Tessaracoccus coleopterorum TaxID=2714950 RepID=UPI0018D36379|nr:hypothetical protein [Tessaracoccus coleopterorum]NHB84899.1 hypothetical protein [Tessaracoccus coleopterorum]
MALEGGQHLALVQIVGTRLNTTMKMMHPHPTTGGGWSNGSGQRISSLLTSQKRRCIGLQSGTWLSAWTA